MGEEREEFVRFHSPLVELVYDLEVHVLRPEHVFVHQIHGSGFVAQGFDGFPGRQELHLEQGVVVVTHDHEVVVA